MSVNILHDGDAYESAEELIGNGYIEFYIYGGRRNIDIFTGDKSKAAPAWEDWYDLLDQVAEQYGKNARGSDVAAVMGLDWMAMYVLLFSGYPQFNTSHDACLLDPWHVRLLNRAEKWFNANYHVCTISRYEHSSVSYSRGAPTCRWDSGYVGFAIVETAKMSSEKFEKYVDSSLQLLTDWANGEVYTVCVEDASGDWVDSCSGYYGYEAAEDAFEEFCKQFEDYKDTSVLQLLNMECRVSALADTCEDLGEHTVNIALAQLSMHKCLNLSHDGEQTEVLSDVDHHRLAHLFESKDHELQDEAAALVSTYCQHYIKHRLEMM
jgi:hypothetical protein